jgi:beta-glucosidase
VEGGNCHNDWWEYEQAGRLPHVSGEACRHWELFEGDFDLARSMGHNAHRFSLEWSRIEPEEGRWDPQAIAHYAEVLRALRERSLEPFVTLHHFTNPSWFLRRGGWTRRESVRLFARFVARIAEELGEHVRHWVTVNEPTVYAMHAYVFGEWPPCRRSSWLQARRVLRNLARAHVEAYGILKRRNPDASVGFAHSAPHIRPCDPKRLRDRVAAALRDELLNLRFLRWIGARPGAVAPPRTLDFLGVNYYTRTLVRSSGLGAGALFGRACKSEHHADRGPRTQVGWEIHPPGLRKVLRRFSALGVPLLVTENGVATEDEQLRTRFLREHLHELARALQDGVPLRGYFYWSLVDNYEWTFGREACYGLAAVDPATWERHPRPCAELYARVCRENYFPEPPLP